MINTGTRKIYALVAAGAMTLATAACGGGDSGGDSGETIKVGMVQPLSGASAAYGEESQAGFEYIIDQINESGGIESMDGAKIELVIADDASDPTKTATEARRLAGPEGVSLIVGTLLTSQMAAISPVANQTQVPVLSLFAGGTNSDYLYTMGLPYDAGYAATMANFVGFLNENYGTDITTAALASSDYEAGQQVDKGLEPRLEDMGISVLERVPLENGGSDYKPAVTRLNSLAPDVVLGLVTTQDGIALHQARAATGSPLLFVGGTGGYADKAVWEALAEDGRQMLVDNTFAMTTFSSEAEQEHLQKFLSEVNDADLGVPIGQNFVVGAQGAWVVKQALENAGSREPADILEGLSEVKIGPDSDQLYMAKSKGIEFGSDRFLTDPSAIIVQWNEDGTQDVVWPEEFSSREPVLTP